MTETHPTREKRAVQIKTYVVTLRDNLARDGAPNVNIIGVKLTRAAANKVADKIAGAHVERHIADK